MALTLNNPWRNKETKPNQTIFTVCYNHVAKMAQHSKCYCNCIKNALSNLTAIISLSNLTAIFPLSHHNHHHHVPPSAQISLTLFHHPSLSFIASDWSSGLHPVSTQSCCMYVRAGCPAFAQPCEGVHKSTSLMILSLLLQQCLVLQ